MGKLLSKKILVFGLIMMMLFATACSGNESASTQEAPESTNEQASSSSEDSENWPSQPINLLVPASAGGGMDIFARSMSDYITKESGQPVVITNIKGYSGFETARTQEPNGYNFILAHNGLLTAKAQGTLDFDQSAFDPVTIVSTDTSTGIIVRSDSPYETLGDLFEAVKKDPQSITGGTVMTGLPYMYMLAINDMLGTDIYCVDAGNAAERNTALLGGQVDFIISNSGATKAYLDSGDFRYLGIAAAERNVFLPDVQTFSEQGYDLVFPAQGMYILAAKGTDKATLDGFNAIIEKVFETEEFVNKMHEMNFGVGMNGKTLSVDDAKTQLDTDAATFLKYVE